MKIKMMDLQDLSRWWPLWPLLLVVPPRESDLIYLKIHHWNLNHVDLPCWSQLNYCFWGDFSAACVSKLTISSNMWTDIRFEDTAAGSSTSKSHSALNTSKDTTGLNHACGGRSTKGFENHPVSSTWLGDSKQE
jgi:hypothetical protein